jgi:hypothetical protein
MASSSSKKSLLTPVAVILVAAGFVYAAFGMEGPEPTAIPEPNVSVSGSLPALPDPSMQDPAVGMQVPAFTTNEFVTGQRFTVEPDGTPRIFGFMVHWCPFCQEEIREMGPWLQDKGIDPEFGGIVNIDGVDIVIISTSHNDAQAGWPTSNLTRAAGLGGALLSDDTSNSIARAFSMSGSPFWVVTDSDGTVLYRLAGKFSMENLESVISDLSASVAQ